MTLGSVITANTRIAAPQPAAEATLELRVHERRERGALPTRSLIKRLEVLFRDTVERRAPRGLQQAIPSPGKNRKVYLAGALHAHTGRLVWRGGGRKNTGLFIELLEHLRASYRSARRIVLILDNYIIHSSRAARRWL